MAGADGQLAARLPSKVFAPICKKVQHRSWTDGDPLTIKSETLKIVFGARRRVWRANLRRRFQSRIPLQVR